MSKIIIHTDQDTVLIANQEIHLGVLIANSVVAGKTAIVRILNTTNKIVKIEKPQVKFESIRDYELIKDNIKYPTRSSEVLSKLKFPDQFKAQLTELCTQYCDVFGLETEAISSNNF